MTSKGQLTVPVEIRRALGLEEGDAVVVELVGGAAMIRKAGRLEDLVGSVQPKKTAWKEARRSAWDEHVQAKFGRSTRTRTSSSGS